MLNTVGSVAALAAAAAAALELVNKPLNALIKISS